MEAETARGKKGESQHLGDPLPLRIQLITELHKRAENTESEAEPLEKEQRRRAHTPLRPRAWGVEGPASTGQTGEPQDLRARR